MLKFQNLKKKNLLKRLNFEKRLDSKLFKQTITLCSWPFLPHILRKYFKIPVGIFASKARKHTHLFFTVIFQVRKSSQNCYNRGIGVTETSAIKNAKWFPCLPKRKILILGSHLRAPGVLRSLLKGKLPLLATGKAHTGVRQGTGKAARD